MVPCCAIWIPSGWRLSRAAKNQQRAFLSGLMLQPEATLMTSSEGRPAQCQLTANHSNTDIPVHNVTNGSIKGISFLLSGRWLQLLEVHMFRVFSWFTIRPRWLKLEDNSNVCQVLHRFPSSLLFNEGKCLNDSQLSCSRQTTGLD